MDQYDDPQPMNDEDTSKGGYEKSDLRKRINSQKSLMDFPIEIWRRMIPFKNGDLIRIPTVSEIFGSEKCDDWCENDNMELIPSMRLRKNRIAYRNSDDRNAQGWLQNAILDSSCLFATVDSLGHPNIERASQIYSTRRVFMLANHVD